MSGDAAPPPTEHVRTGLTARELIDAANDPTHPAYHAAKAQLSAFSGEWSPSLRTSIARLTQQLAAASPRPDIEALFQALVPTEPPRSRPPMAELFGQMTAAAPSRPSGPVEPPEPFAGGPAEVEPPPVPEPEPSLIDFLSQLTERVAVMTGATQEQLDLAKAGQASAERERDEARRHARRANTIALVGLVVAVVSAVAAVLAVL